MKIALHEITSRNAGLAEDLAAYAEAGWTAFELHLAKATDYSEQHGRQAFRDLVRQSGLKPVACTGHVVRAFGNDEATAGNTAAFRMALDTMEEVECPVIVFGGDGPETMPGTTDFSEAGLSGRDRAYRAVLERFAERVGRLADLASERGVTMALEMNWCRLCRSVRSAADVLDLVDRPNVGFLFDAAHVAVSPSRLEDLDRVKGRIVHGHLDDMRDVPPEMWNVNHDRVIPGDGALPLRAWYEKVEACGYTGWHAVELFCQDLWSRPVGEIAVAVRDGCRKVWPDARF